MFRARESHRRTLTAVLWLGGGLALVALCGHALAQKGASSKGVSPASTKNAAVSYSDVYEYETAEVIDNASSTLLRSVLGVSFTFGTTDLEPRGAYTVWVVVFNNPEHCSERPCVIDDLFNPKVGGTAFWEGGRVSDDFGQATLTGNVLAGVTPPEDKMHPAFEPLGLLDARKAEIHLVLRDHGPAETLMEHGVLDEALATFGGGCDINECEDVQFSIHLP